VHHPTILFYCFIVLLFYLMQPIRRDDKEERMREQLEREIELELKAEEIVETNDFTWRAVIIGTIPPQFWHQRTWVEFA